MYPVAVKDVILSRKMSGLPADRKLLEHYIPPYDATAVVRIWSRPVAYYSRQDKLRRVCDGIVE